MSHVFPFPLPTTGYWNKVRCIRAQILTESSDQSPMNPNNGELVTCRGLTLGEDFTDFRVGGSGAGWIGDAGLSLENSGMWNTTHTGIVPNPNYTGKMWFWDMDTGFKLYTLRNIVVERVTRPDILKAFWVNCQGGNTIGVGSANPTVTGTVTADNDAASSYNAYDTIAGAGNAGFSSASFALSRVTHSPLVTCVLKTKSGVTGLRLWLGLVDSAPTNSDTGPANIIGFRYSDAVDGGIVGVVRDGTTQQVTAALTAGVAANTQYKLQARVDGPNRTVYFSVNGGAEVALAVNLPANGTDLGFACRIFATDITVSVGIRCSRFYVEGT